MILVVLTWMLSAAPKADAGLPPEADLHNRVAMAHYDVGRLEEAMVEFRAAYDAMPDVQRDRERRDWLLDSMHATLIELHERDGSPEPLCRLVPLLESHIAGLRAAFPGQPEFGEIKFAGARQRLKDRLAAFAANVCEAGGAASGVASPAVEDTRADEPVGSAVTIPEPTRGPTTVGAPGRSSLIAGGVLLPLGLVALGVLGGVASVYHRDLDEADALDAALELRPGLVEDRERMRELLAAIRREEGSMVALGTVGGVLAVTGVALLVRGGLQRRRARAALDVRTSGIGLTISGEF